MPLINETLQQLEQAARSLALRMEKSTTSGERGAYNEALQNHLTAVVDYDSDQPLADAIENWCQRFGLQYLPEPEAKASSFTKRTADECLRYARRYSCTLHDAIADWEGEDERGGFGMAPGEKSEVAGYLKALGFDLDKQRNPAEDPEA